jgi:3-phosphoshikimate 1-carboxyvinyltransferase
VINNVLDCEDTNDCLNALRTLGINIGKGENNGTTFIINGCEGIFPANITNIDVNVGSSGITCRFLLAIICAVLSKDKKSRIVRLSASEQLTRRPIGPLVDSLGNLGTNIKYLGKNGHLPLEIRSAKLSGKSVSVSGTLSSQYVSAVLMMCPLLDDISRVEVTDIDSDEHPYIQMTIQTMKSFGIDGINEEGNTYTISPQNYRASNMTIETDLNTTNYFFALAAATNGSVRIENVNFDSLQPGLLFLDVLEKIGCSVIREKNSVTVKGTGRLRGGFRIDMFKMAEMVTLLAVLAIFADSPIEIYNVKHIRNHESDRIAAIASELRKTTIRVEEFDDGIKILPSEASFAVVSSHNDHRMAMALAIMGIGSKGVAIDNHICVTKTCPEFFKILEYMGIEMKYG